MNIDALAKLIRYGGNAPMHSSDVATLSAQ
jgi:hypothetical protein